MPSEQPNGASSSRRHSDGSRRGAFTLTELIVVMVIIIILMAILIPMASHVRQSARAAATQQLIMTLTAAIEQYRNDWGAYPGPLGYNEVGYTGASNDTMASLQTVPSAAGFASPNATHMTMSENLVLGLMGGLRLEAGAPVYDPALVGQGPQSLGSGQRRAPYLTNVTLSWRGEGSTSRDGHYADDGGDAVDSIIPEILDEFPDRLPILYLRARVGVTRNGPDVTLPGEINPIITNTVDPATNLHVGPYDLLQIKGYVSTSIGVGKSKIDRFDNGAPVSNSPAHGLRSLQVVADPPKPPVFRPLDPTNTYPYDAYPYFTSRTIPNTPRNKDGFILISAGKDRIYGTDDDICNFGAVRE